MTAVPAADLLVQRLAAHGVRHVFGYPGGQLTPVYDALYRTPSIRHYLARHEQAAAFMADGFARATGRVGVCLAVCGPGVLNAATPLAAAFTDSVPVLLISGQIPSAAQGLRSGFYHENEQLRVVAPFTKWQGRIDQPGKVIPVLDEAVRQATSGRPGPVLVEAPVDVLRTETPAEDVPLPPAPPRTAPNPAEVEAVARLMSNWKRPLILAGGGVVSAGAESLLVRLAERLGAPVQHTLNGKTAFPASHPLAAGLTWSRATADVSGMADFISPLFAAADGLLAVGCRFTQAATGSWELRPPPLVHIDIDAEEIGRHYPVAGALVADSSCAIAALLDALPPTPRSPWTARPARTPWRLPGMDLVGPIRRALPADAIVSADVTRLAYILMAELPLDVPRTWLHPAGAVSMGYGLPAALGALAGLPGRKVLTVCGDGGLMMSALELATAVQERLPVVVLLVNDNSLTLIRATQERRYQSRFHGVDLLNPDFGRLAAAFGVAYDHPTDDAALEAALRRALERDGASLIEVRPADAREHPQHHE
jgi:acetolactate synthase-1/2/3 large subunit